MAQVEEHRDLRGPRQLKSRRGEAVMLELDPGAPGNPNLNAFEVAGLGEAADTVGQLSFQQVTAVIGPPSIWWAGLNFRRPRLRPRA